jgi:hypothetical protein
MSSTGQAPTAKVCILCKKDCSKVPRTKDQHGRYTCRACLEKRRAAQPAVPSAAESAHALGREAAEPADAGDNDLLAQLVAESPAVNSPVCPGCNLPMAPDAVVCLACGLNTRTGQRAPVAVRDSARVGGGARAAGLAAVAAGAAAKGTFVLLAPVIGGIAGGALGAAIWAGVSYGLGLEYGWVAWGVGVLVGIGVAAGARGSTGTITGVLAVVIATASVLAGKFAAVSLAFDKVGGQVAERLQFTEEMAIGSVAQEVVEEWKAAGKRLDWPAGMDPRSASSASSEAEFPKDVWSEARRRWAARPEDWRRQFLAAREEAMKAEFAAFMHSAKGEGFLADFTLFDVLWFILAVASAYAVGSGAGVGDDDD